MVNSISSHKFTLALVQMSMDEDVETNINRAIGWCEKAVRQSAQVICLPELFASRYFCQREDTGRFQYAESADGPLMKRFARFSEENAVVMIVPFFERRGPGVYHNSVMVINADGNPLGLYRKMHIPDDPAYYEKYYFAPGDLGFKAFDTHYGRIAPLICWDQWYPEAARVAALRGAGTLLYPTAIGWHPHEKEACGQAQLDAWRTVQRGHAIANGVYLGAANRVGFEPEEHQARIQFWGSSFICGPQGELLAESSSDGEELLLAEIDPEHLETIRQ
ncbi:MAG TPA: carbon-nitrogen hydrolase, partial [Candidatus Hydrogenedentes bacterium]|nr:carbon-nitrogen hydrolase [Candidatus Hydrogenedentota bacterium]